MGKDVLCVMPTGYGKSLIFHLLPVLEYFKRVYSTGQELEMGLVNSVPTVVIVILPLNALMHDQVCRLLSDIVRVIISIKHGDLDDSICEKSDLERGGYNILFSHPEALVSCKYVRSLMLNKIYQDNVCTVVVDEAHCMLEWLVQF